MRVANARGSFFAVADVSDRVRPGVVASTKGRWPGDSKEGATVNATVDERDSDMGGGAVYHDNRVRVDRSAPSAVRGLISPRTFEMRSAGNPPRRACSRISSSSRARYTQ